MLQTRIFSEDANMAVFTALAVIPILSVIGLTLDFHGTVRAEAKAQSVLDQAAIAAARAQQRLGDANLAERAAQALVDTQLSSYSAAVVCDPALATVDPDERTVFLSLSCRRDTSIMGIIGFDEMPFRVETEAAWLVDSLEVAFVFDTSSSMKSDLGALQSAATEALDILLPASGPGPVNQVRVAAVSYATMVNAGDLFEVATGMTPRRTYEADNHYIESGVSKTKTASHTIDSTCVYERHGKHAFTDAAPDPSPPGHTPITTPASTVDRMSRSFSGPDEAKALTLSRSVDNPHGFIGAQAAIYEDDSLILSGRWRESFKSKIHTCLGPGPVPLTDDRDALDTYVASLVTDYLTAGHQGIAWGWYLLSPKWASLLPAGSKPAAYSDRQTVKAMILMTDGDFGTYLSTGSGSAKEMAEKLGISPRTLRYKLAKMRDAGIEIPS